MRVESSSGELATRPTHVLVETIALEPSDLLAGDLDLVVDALDGEEDLAEATALHDVELPLGHEPSAIGRERCGERRRRRRRRRKERKEREERQRVGQITEGVREGRVPVGRDSGRRRGQCELGNLRERDWFDAHLSLRMWSSL